MTAGKPFRTMYSVISKEDRQQESFQLKLYMLHHTDLELCVMNRRAERSIPLAF